MFTDDVLQSFNELDYVIYNTVLRTGNKLAHMQVRDLADAAHVSPASVVRFCKKAGCKGYAEFRYRYCDSLKAVPARQSGDQSWEIKTFLENSHGAEFTQSAEKAVELLHAASQIICVGVGASSDLASFGARIFSNVGHFSLCINDPFLSIPSFLAERPVVVAISFSGSTEQTVTMTKRFVESGCKVVSITGSDKNPLARIADVNLSYFVKSIPIQGGYDLGTQVPALYILELLGRRLYACGGGK